MSTSNECHPSDASNAVPSLDSETIDNVYTQDERVYSGFSKRLLSIAAFIILPTPAIATDFTRCCVVRAREPEMFKKLGHNPWTSCGFDSEYYSKAPDTPNPSVTATLGWCRAHCPGFQPSGPGDWMQPLATWIAPAIAFLLLCPLGEPGKKPKKEKPEKKNYNKGQSESLFLDKCWAFIKALLSYIVELASGYIEILGDPGSAVGGSLLEVITDTSLVNKLSLLKPPIVRSEIARVIVGGHLDFDNIDPKPYSYEKVSQSETLEQRKKQAVQTIITANVGFSGGVFIPCILAIAVAASVFYDAYNKHGDKSTAHNLAYGVWYNWLLVLAVSANCSIAGKPSVVAEAFRGPEWPYSNMVSLRKRYANACRWTDALISYFVRNGSLEADNSTEFRSGWAFYWRYFYGQTLGAICVAIFSACAFTISYTTPTVGIGCRSLNFLLYGALAFPTAWLMVLRHWVTHGRTHNATHNATPDSKATRNGTPGLGVILKWFYKTLVFFNFLVLVLGTAFHLSGFFKSCRCSSLSSNPETILELAPYTELAKKNASNWKMVGHLSYSIAWIMIAASAGWRSVLVNLIEKNYLKSVTDPKEPDFKEPDVEKWGGGKGEKQELMHGY